MLVGWARSRSGSGTFGHKPWIEGGGSCEFDSLGWQWCFTPFTGCSWVSLCEWNGCGCRLQVDTPHCPFFPAEGLLLLGGLIGNVWIFNSVFMHALFQKTRRLDCVFGDMYCGATLQSHKFALYTNSHCHCRVVNYKTLVLTWCRYVANLYATSVRSPDSQNSHAASNLVG